MRTLNILTLIDARNDILEDPTLGKEERDARLEALEHLIDQEREKI